jgi:hypothetical protein
LFLSTRDEPLLRLVQLPFIDQVRFLNFQS